MKGGVHFDELLERLGSLGRYQVINLILIGVTVTVVGCHHMGTVFLAGVPTYHCHHGGDQGGDQGGNQSGDKGGDHGGDMLYTPGNLNVTWVDSGGDECYVREGNATTKCRAWTYDIDTFEETIVTEWDLVCSSQWRVALSQSIYMLGSLCGAVTSGKVSDVYGRKIALFAFLLTMVTTASAAAYMPAYWLFVATRFLVGASAMGLFTAAFVLTMEILGIRHRLFFGVFFQAWFALGYMLLAGLAFLVRDYHVLQLVIGVVPVIFLPLWFVLDESPRWLLTEGRTKAAFTVISKMAALNRKSEVLDEYKELSSDQTQLCVASQDTNADAKNHAGHTILDLLRTPNLRAKTLNSCLQWFTVSMMYYGLSLGVSDLAGGVHLNLFLSGLMEFPSFFLSIFLMARIGRRISLTAFNVTGGVACTLMAVLPARFSIAITCASLVGKLAISGSFALIYVYSAELFPTVARTLGVGSGSMCARIGGLLSPFIALSGKLWSPLPYFIFGALSLATGAAALLLPETLNQPLPETLEEAEQFGRKFTKRISQTSQKINNAIV